MLVRAQMEALLIQLDEGVIQAPPKLYKRIKEWVISAVATYQVKIYKKIRRGNPEATDLLIANWEPLIKQKVKVSMVGSTVASEQFVIRRREFPSLKGMPKSKMPLSKITVELLKDFPGAGGFDENQALLVLRMPGFYDTKGISKSFDKSGTGETLRHELIHIAQTLMSGAIGGEQDVRVAGKVVRRVARPGMPSKRIMTPGVVQFGKSGAEFEKTRKELERLGLNPDLVTHSLDDIEFYTALTDAMGYLKKFPLDDFNRAEKSKVVGIFVGSLKAPNTRPFDRKAWARFDPRKKIFDLMHPGANRREPLKPNASFMIWKRHAPGKWRKAVKELSKAL